MSDQPAAASPETPRFLPPGEPPSAPPAPVTPGPEFAQAGYGMPPSPPYQAGYYPPGENLAAAAPVPAGTYYAREVNENVGRGIAFSLLGALLGAVLSAVIYQWGFIASITSFLMAVAAVWLYSKGAGAPPRAGVVPLIAVIVAGVVLSLFTMLGWTLYTEIAADYPQAGFGEIMPVVMDNLFYPPVWSVFATDALLFVAFAALGTFGSLRQLRRSAVRA